MHQVLLGFSFLVFASFTQGIVLRGTASTDSELTNHIFGEQDTQDLASGLKRGVLPNDRSDTQMASDLQHAILARFEHSDSNSDGVLTLDEMKTAFNAHSDHEVSMLRKMLDQVSTNKSSAIFKEDMAAYVRKLDDPSWIKGLNTHLPNRFVQREGSKCGPSIPTSTQVEWMTFFKHNCWREGPICWDVDAEATSTLAWALPKLCEETSPCLCEPDLEAKAFSWLGLTGAMSAASGSEPQCGLDWEADLIVATADLGRVKPEEASTYRALLEYFGTPEKPLEEYAGYFDKQKQADVEINLYRTASHGALELAVCVIAWHATETYGDWKANLMLDRVDFFGLGTTIEGYSAMYNAVLDPLYETIQDKCCSEEFIADKFVITGHSMGGGFAFLNAADMVTNWNCTGKDLGAEHIIVTTFAPNSAAIDESFMDSVFSCSDETKCLPGRIVTVTTANDYVGNGIVALPIHPSTTTRIECQGPSVDAPQPTWYQIGHGPLWSSSNLKWWCHGLFEYQENLEMNAVTHYWGSTCNGKCGNFYEQVHLIQMKQAESPSAKDYVATQSLWDPVTARCIHPHLYNADLSVREADKCWKMTKLGYCVP